MLLYSFQLISVIMLFLVFDSLKEHNLHELKGKLAVALVLLLFSQCSTSFIAHLL